MRTAYPAGIVVGVLLWSGAVARADEPATCAVSANIDTSQELVRVIQRLSERSPTFRRQCGRIAGARYLRVRIGIDPHMPTVCRAYTVIRRAGRQLHANVQLPPSANHAELIAHEFEHVIEQLEGLDLRRLAHTRGSGVRELEGELFETDRAKAAGRLVADEARRHAPGAD